MLPPVGRVLRGVSCARKCIDLGIDDFEVYFWHMCESCSEYDPVRRKRPNAARNAISSRVEAKDGAKNYRGV